MKRTLILTSLCIGLTACASAPREQASQLAKSGAEASDAAARDIRELSAQVDRQAELMAFNGTYLTCTLAPAECKPEAIDRANAAEARKLMQAINLRASALTALGDAYRAMGAEAGYDAEGSMRTVVGRLTSSVNAYASLLGAAPLVSAPVGGIITESAGLLARDRQRARLRAGSERLRLAVGKMREALALEQTLYSGLAGALALQENKAVENLFSAGLIARAPLLTSMAADLGVTLSPDAELTLANNVGARTAAQAYIRGQADDRQYLQEARYLAIADALTKLEQAHSDFEQTDSPDIADLTRAIDTVTALIPAPEEAAR